MRLLQYPTSPCLLHNETRLATFCMDTICDSEKRYSYTGQRHGCSRRVAENRARERKKSLLTSPINIVLKTRKGLFSVISESGVMEKRNFVGLFLIAVVRILAAEGQEAEKEYPPYDGWYNNRAHPEWGVVDMPLTRRLPSHYEDGVYMPSGWKRPNPRMLSQELMKGVTGKNSYLKKTAFMVFFGQQVVEEILDAQRPGCPPEYFNIKIPKDDELYDADGTGTVEIPLLRSRYQQAITGFSPNFPRQQLNEITSFIDGGLTYGVNKAWADALRLHNHCDGRTASSNIFASQSDHTDCRGELASSNDEGRLPIENTIGLPLANPPPPRDHELKSATRFYRLGNPRGNENPFLLTFGVLWFRYHNYLARKIREEHLDYSDEKVYNEARVLNIATHQKIVFYDWLPIFLGECPDTAPNCTKIPKYNGYKSSIHPGITHAFQSAAMRFGHTLVPPGVFRRSRYNKNTGTCTFYNTTLRTAGESHNFQEAHLNRKGLRTCNTYWNSIEAINENRGQMDEDGFSELVMGMASQICEREDNIITPDLRGSVFGPLEFSRRDLMAINIQRGRDHGLPDYNTAREYLGLGRRETFKEVNPDLFDDTDRDGPNLLEKFIKVHGGKLDNIDIWTGGLLETTTNGPGELFREIILDQFVRIRDGDRFWFENRENGLLSDEQFEFVMNTAIKNVILHTNPGMEMTDIQDNPFVWNETDPYALCPQPYALNETDMEECTPPKHYDYFTGSEIPYAISWAAIGLYILLMLLLLFILGRRSMSKRQASQKRTDRHSSIDSDAIVAIEILGKADRQIQVIFGPGKVIQTKTTRGARLRTIPLHGSIRVMQSSRGRRNIYACYIDTETYDLILSFPENHDRSQFHAKLKDFTNGERIQLDERLAIKEQQLMKMLRTKEARDSYLKKFFRDVTAWLYDDSKNAAPSPQNFTKYANIEMSKHEFAANLHLKPNSLFVEQIFQIADKDSNGTISYREFMDIMWIFSKGDANSKAKLMFDMYDLDRSGTLTMEEFRLMLRSTMDMVSVDVTDSAIDVLTQEIMQRHGFQHKSRLNSNDFQTVMSQYSDVISASAFDEDDSESQNTDSKKGAIVRNRETRLLKAKRTVKEHVRRSTEPSNDTCAAATDAAPQLPERKPRRRNTVKIELHEQRKEPTTTFEKRSTAIEKYIRNYRMHIYWITLYTLVAWAIFAERVYYYSVEREHGGLKRICGLGVSFTRGAASGMMFTYSSLLVTMSRNTITFLRETFLGRYIPFDAAVSMHRYIAWQAVIFTVIHIFGHSINFYSIATQPASDVGCLFPDYWRQSNELPSFQYWAWQTITGVTGIICTLVVITMYVFASNYSRRWLFRWFWWTHSLGYVLLFLLMILHGSGFLVQRPFFYYFFLGPAVLYTLDKLYSISRNKNEISVVRAELLPSNVTFLEFKKPKTFDYKAGQWVRIACLAQSHNEYHPFTLTSSPQENTLKLHIRAVGPWTKNIRNIYDPDRLRDSPYPKLFLDGPFGEGHQDWYKYDVSILVGGGIGVTPFASILKDLVHKTKVNQDIRCKKVFFMWLTRDQKEFEWLTDIIREAENEDTREILEPHIFITQIPARYDFRTIMLYVCERNFQRLSGRSLFTGLSSVTHFGRPRFKDFFKALSCAYKDKVEEFGVFSCGPAPMTQSVEDACAAMNKFEGAIFSHHFENF